MSGDESTALMVRAELACGVVAGPLFVIGFSVIGARRVEYDWRRHAVSSLADGRGGWLQRANFMLTDTLYCIAAEGLARSAKPTAASRAVPALVFGVGAGLVGSGLFVTDPVAGFPPSSPGRDDPGRVPSAGGTSAGRLHNLSAIPIFAGIPVAAVASATAAARRGEVSWSAYSASSAMVMLRAFALFARAFGGAPRLAGQGGLWQRVSVTAGFGWLSALSLRTLTSVRRARRP